MLRAHRARQERAPFPTCGPLRGRRGTQGYRTAPPTLPLLITAVLALLLATVIAGSAPTPAEAQAIRGTVLDDIGGTPVLAAIVRLHRGGDLEALRGAETDSLAPEHPAEVLKGTEKIDVRWTWGEN